MGIRKQQGLRNCLRRHIYLFGTMVKKLIFRGSFYTIMKEDKNRNPYILGE